MERFTAIAPFGKSGVEERLKISQWEELLLLLVHGWGASYQKIFFKTKTEVLKYIVHLSPQIKFWD
jgi:hypothetical protein